MSHIRKHLTYANVMATLAVFIALGGTALASVIISSNSQVASGTISGRKPPSGKHANIIANSINGKDIADRSGVDTCQAPLVGKFGPICAGSDGGARTLRDALNQCTGLGLQLPTLSEAVTLGEHFDVPGVSGLQEFWTDEEWVVNNALNAQTVDENGTYGSRDGEGKNQTVCVTDPSA
jgi:hypothetical protein